MNHHFSENLKIVKKTFKLNNSELGSLLGVHGDTLSKWINGRNLNYAKQSLIMKKLRELIRKSA